MGGSQHPPEVAFPASLGRWGVIYLSMPPDLGSYIHTNMNAAITTYCQNFI
jgi:hypothetical protein